MYELKLQKKVRNQEYVALNFERTNVDLKHALQKFEGIRKSLKITQITVNPFLLCDSSKLFCRFKSSMSD